MPWRRALTPNVLRLGLVSFFADVSSEMLYPLMPLFITMVLGAPVAAVGLIEGAAESTAAMLKTVSGRIADRSRRRVHLVFGGYALSALARPLIALAHVWPIVLCARMLDRVGKGLRGSPRDAIIADSTTPDLRGAAFGWHRAMDTLGAVLGPLLALGLLAMFHDNLRVVIVIAAVPGAIGALLVLTVRDPRRDEAAVERPATPAPSFRDLPRGFVTYLAAWLPFVLVNSSDVFLILRAKQIGLSMTGVVLIYTLYNVVYAAASLPLGALSDRIGRRHVMVGGLLVFAVVYLGFAVATTPWQVATLFGIYGLYIAATDGVGKAFAVDLVPKTLRGTAIGLLGTVTGITTLIASAAAGLLWDHVGPGAPFIAGAIGALVSAALFAVLPLKSER